MRAAGACGWLERDPEAPESTRRRSMMNPTMNQQPGPRDPVFPDPVFPEPVFPDEFVPVDLRGTPLRSAAYVLSLIHI